MLCIGRDLVKEFFVILECLMMVMRWLYVLVVNFGFIVSAKWVILIVYIGSVNCGKGVKEKWTDKKRR